MIRPYVHLKWMIKEELKRLQYLLLLGQDQLERHNPVHEDTEWAEKEKSLLRVGQIVMYTGGSSNSTLGMNNEEKKWLGLNTRQLQGYLDRLQDTLPKALLPDGSQLGKNKGKLIQTRISMGLDNIKKNNLKPGTCRRCN